jgi:hypothetical protein
MCSVLFGHASQTPTWKNRNRVKMERMKRQLIALLMILAIGLQVSVAAYAAAAPVMQSDCQSSAEYQNVSDNSCCPSGVHIANCCLDACMMTANVSLGSIPMIWSGHSVFDPQFEVSAFSSRGDAPLIRPPIL